MTQVNLTNYQGVNPHEHWLSGVLLVLGCVWGAETTCIRLHCFRCILGVNA